MADVENDKLLLHWDDADREVAAQHRIDADTLTQTINGVQEVLYLIAMDHEGREPNARVKIPQEIRKRFQITFDATIPASFCLSGVVGANDDLTAPAVVPEVTSKFFDVMTLLANGRNNADYAKEFAFAVRNPSIRRRVANTCGRIIPRKGSGRTFSMTLGTRHKIRIDEHGHERLARMTPVIEPENAPLMRTLIGKLNEMDFEKRTFQLYYPPTQTLIDCKYNDDNEIVLVDCRREYVQVKGIVVFSNDKEIPIRIDSVESVVGLDLSDIVLSRIPFQDGRNLSLNRELVLKPQLDSESRQLLEVSDSDTGIDTFAQTRDEVIESIYDDIEAIWFHYVENTSPLTEEAARIGNWWRTNAHFVGGE